MIARLENKLLQRKHAGNMRSLRITGDLIDFASNDYLGLSQSGYSLQTGSTGSRLLTGNSHIAEQLEHEIADFHGYERGVLFSCGYMANLGLISTVASHDDMVIYDSAIHASMRDGIRLSRSHACAFRHNDLAHLQMRLEKMRCGGAKYILVESMYSTDGSQAPLIEICRMARTYGAHVIVDEAHAVGLFGPKGRGLVAKHELQDSVLAQVVTFGKALGAHGAIVLGSDLLAQALINFATPYIYTTALPPLSLMAIKHAYEVFPHMERERGHLRQIIKLMQHETQILSVRVPGNSSVQKASEELKAQGFDVRALMSPTVRRGDEVLRICLHAFNAADDVLALRRALECYA